MGLNVELGAADVPFDAAGAGCPVAVELPPIGSEPVPGKSPGVARATGFCDATLLLRVTAAFS